jgi:cell division protease FtsH
VAGLEKKNRLLNARERQIVAFHECGHALISIALPGCEVVQKISIIPRGIGALGYTMHRPIEDRYLMSKEELENKMTTLLGGRAAELLVFQQLSTGASDDLLKATDIARSMITRYGMSSELGPVTLEPESKSFLPVPVQEMLSARQYSEETARQIDSGVRTLLEEAHARALAILSQRRDLLELSATRLLEKETITGVELAALVSEKNQAGSLKAAESAPDASSETASQSQLSFIASES